MSNIKVYFTACCALPGTYLDLSSIGLKNSLVPGMTLISSLHEVITYCQCTLIWTCNLTSELGMEPASVTASLLAADEAAAQRVFSGFSVLVVEVPWFSAVSVAAGVVDCIK